MIQRITSKIRQNHLSLEERTLFYTYIDRFTNKKVKLSYIFTKNQKTNQTILLCHGMFSHKNSKFIIKLLNGLKEHFSILRFDFEGNGESSGEWSYADYPREVRDIGRMVFEAENSLGVKIVSIIGHSKGGTDVLMAASDSELIKNKDCCFISLAGRFTFGMKEKRFTKEEIYKAKGEGYFMWKLGKRKWKITKEALDERKKMDLKEVVKNINNYRAQKILHIHGTNDTTIPYEEANVIKKELPEIEIKTIQNANHFFIGKEEELINTILDWLKIKIL